MLLPRLREDEAMRGTLAKLLSFSSSLKKNTKPGPSLVPQAVVASWPLLGLWDREFVAGFCLGGLCSYEKNWRWIRRIFFFKDIGFTWPRAVWFVLSDYNYHIFASSPWVFFPNDLRASLCVCITPRVNLIPWALYHNLHFLFAVILCVMILAIASC